ncbi:MAG TPA: hypothetical protein VG944_13295 [Fimbriimonas sp.]|nr:hypothetical protein [Fimbriimonas sp.]
MCSCTSGKATVVSSIIPITSAERDWYAEHNDMMAMIDLFEAKGVGAEFDPRRPSAVRAQDV